MATYLERYLNGEYEQVWSELIALGERVRQEPIYSEACAVAEEAMRRVRANAEVLVPRLEALGYKFGGWKNYKGPLSPPLPDARQRLQEIEENYAQIPIAWRACCEIIGGIDFSGEHRGWKRSFDGLVIEGENIVEYFSDWGEYEDEDGTLILYLSLFVVDGAGGIGGKVPNGVFDAPLEYDDEGYIYGKSLIHYLRLCILGWGGLIIFPEEGDAPIPHVDDLIKDLIPF